MSHTRCLNMALGWQPEIQPRAQGELSRMISTLTVGAVSHMDAWLWQSLLQVPAGYTESGALVYEQNNDLLVQLSMKRWWYFVVLCSWAGPSMLLEKLDCADGGL